MPLVPKTAWRELKYIEYPLNDDEKEEFYEFGLYLQIFGPTTEVENPLVIIATPKLTKLTEVEDPTSDTIEDDDFQDNQQLGLDMPKKNWIS